MPKFEFEQGVLARVRRWQQNRSGSAQPSIVQPGHVFHNKQKSRAVVTLIAYGESVAIQKVFRPDCTRYLEREIHARTALQSRFPEFPPLLEQGEVHIVSQYYPNAWMYRRRGLTLFPLSIAKRVIEIYERLYDAGYALLDGHPRNLLDETGAIRLFDLEFLHRYGDDKPATFFDSWDLKGPPSSYEGDLPAGGPVTWERHWHYFVGATAEEIKHGSPLTLAIKRARHWATVFLPRQIKDRLHRRRIRRRRIVQ